MVGQPDYNYTQIILYIAAFCGEFFVCTEKEISKILKKLKMREPENLGGLINKLRMREMLVSTKSLYDDKRLHIADSMHLALVGELYTDPDAKALLDVLEAYPFAFDSSRRDAREFRTWLLDATGLKHTRYKFVPTPSFNWTETKILEPIMDSAVWSAALEKMPLDKLANCAINCVSKRFSAGKDVDWNQMQALYDNSRFTTLYGNNASFGNYGTSYLREFMHVFRFLMTGTEAKGDVAMNKWGLLYQAVVDTYNGNYSRACDNYAEALKTWGQYWRNDRVAFDNFVFNYLYAMALMLDGSKQSEQRLEKMVSSSFFAVDTLYGSTLVPFIKYVTWSQPFESNGQFNWSNKLDVPTASLINGMMNFALNTDITYSRKSDKAHYAITALEENPDTSLILKLKVRQPWEKAMDELEEHEFVTEKKDSDLVQRIVYVMDPYMEITPMVQRQDKHGEWSSALRKLWPQSKIHDLPEFASEEDRKLLIRLAPGQARFSGPQALMAFVGNDKLIRREIVKGEGLQPVTIRIEKPYLIVDELPDGSFAVSSNVTVSDLENGNETFVRRQDENNLEIMQLQSWEKPAFKILLQVGNMPATAKPRLLKLLERLKHCTDIHSTLIESELNPIDGDSRLVVRMFPRQHQSGKWSLRLKVIPSMLTPFTEIPGEGRNLYVVTNADGQRVQLKRNLQQEKLHLHQFLDFMGQLLDLEYDESDPDYPGILNYCEDTNYDLELLLQIVEWIQEHPDDVVVEMMNGAKFHIRGYASLGKISIASTKRHDWFEVEGEVKLDQTQVESLSAFLNRLDEGIGDYIRLDEDSFVKMTQELRQKVHVLRTLLQNQGDSLMAHKSAFVSLDNALGSELQTKDQLVRNLRHQLHANEEESVAVSEKLCATLKPYQLEGFQWLARLSKWAGGACLADDMGLGKTVQAIALMLHLQADGPALVVAPTSVLANWKKELEKFAPSLNVRLLYSGINKEETLADLKAGDVVVTTYGLMLSAHAQIAEVKWGIAILDEAHMIKNPTTKTYHAACKIDAKFRLVLTGTPVQNHLTDLWSLFQFILPGMLGGFNTFRNRYIDLEEGTYGTAERIGQLRKAVAPFILRRTKTQVLKDLPDLQESVRYVRLSGDEQTVYEATRLQTKKNVNALLQNVSVSGGKKMEVLSLLTTLREIPCSCSLVFPSWNVRSSKEEALVDLLREIDLEKNGVLVFSQFTSFLKEVRQILEEEGIATYYLDGSTPQKARWEMIDQYQNGVGPAVFLISLKAGGVGLNLTRANYVIHMDPWWNPSVERQATDRSHRIGQENPVTVYHMIAEHTIEEKMLALQETKKFISDTVLLDSHNTNKLTMDDIISLLEDVRG